jgi:hypothetical protein
VDLPAKPEDAELAILPGVAIFVPAVEGLWRSKIQVEKV